MLARRELLAAAALAAAGCTRGPPNPTAELAAIRAALGGRLGVAALDTGSGRTVALDPDSRYGLASTFKVPLAAAVLARVERGELALDTPVRFSRADLVPYAPVVEANLAAGRLSIAQLCAAAVELSDNVAANLLLARVGGPAGLTRFMRACGDPTTRLDRIEPALNVVQPGDPRDTTTPAAMVGLMRALLLGPVLAPSSRARLIGWMEASGTGRRRLRAGLPSDWRAGDKTGTSSGGLVNDIAIAWPPGRAPILIAAYVDRPKVAIPQAEAAHAEVARVVARALR